MRAVALVGRSVGRTAGLLAGVGALLAGFQVLLVAVAASQQESQSFDLITRLVPAFVQRQFGATLPAFLSFGGLVSLGYFHPVVVLSIAIFAAFLASELAADVEGGQVDLLLARSLARHRLVTRSLVVAFLAPLIFVFTMTAASRAALGALAPAGADWPSFGSIGRLAAHLVAIAWCFGALGLALATMVRRRASAFGPAALIAVALYLLDLIAAAWPAIESLAMLSPFHYYQGAAVLGGRADTPRDLLVLGMIAAVLVSTAYWRFSVRDL